MSISDLRPFPELHDRWVAIDPRGGRGLLALRTGAVVVDLDPDLDALCLRVSASRRSSLTILYCGERPRS